MLPRTADFGTVLVFFTSILSGVHSADVVPSLLLALRDSTATVSSFTTHLNISIRITNRIYNDTLEDPNSADYKRLRKEVRLLLNSALDGKSNYGGITDMAFSNGSVIADTTVQCGRAAVDPAKVKDSVNMAKTSMLELQENFTKVIQSSPPPELTGKKDSRSSGNQTVELSVGASPSSDPTTTSALDSHTVPSNSPSDSTANSGPPPPHSTPPGHLSHVTSTTDHSLVTPIPFPPFDGSRTIAPHTSTTTTTPHTTSTMTTTPHTSTTTTTPHTSSMTTTSHPSSMTTHTPIMTTHTPNITTPPSSMTTTTHSSNITPHRSNVTTPHLDNMTTPHPSNITTTHHASNITTTHHASNITAYTSNMTTPNRSNMTTTPDFGNMTTPDFGNVTTPHGSNMTTPHGSNMTTPHFSNMTTPHFGNMTTTPHPSNMTSKPHSSSTTSPHSNSAVPSSSSDGTPGWGIALLVLAALILLLVLIFLVYLMYYCCCRRTEPTPYMPFNPDIPMYSTQSTIDLHNGKAYDDRADKARSGMYEVNPATPK